MRMRMPIAPDNDFYPLSRQGLYRYNRLRMFLAALAAAAGLSPDVEKPDPVPPRPESGRRLAHLWVPRWGLRNPGACRLALTGGLRAGAAVASAADGSQAIASSEGRKRMPRHRPAICASQPLLQSLNVTPQRASSRAVPRRVMGPDALTVGLEAPETVCSLLPAFLVAPLRPSRLFGVGATPARQRRGQTAAGAEASGVAGHAASALREWMLRGL